MIIIKNDNNIGFKKEIHTKLRKNNIEKCEWLKNNISEDINVTNKVDVNFLAFDNGKLIGGAIGFIRVNRCENGNLEFSSKRILRKERI